MKNLEDIFFLLKEMNETLKKINDEISTIRVKSDAEEWVEKRKLEIRLKKLDEVSDEEFEKYEEKYEKSLKKID
jgi:uncharacterized HAD superfamily protein